MPILRFPPPDQAQEGGVLAVGGDVHPKSLLLAYQQGIFPWPVDGVEGHEGPVLVWFCPPERALLFFDDITIPRSLAKARRKAPYTFSFDRAFDTVIEKCAALPRPGQSGTWITSELIDGYRRFHKLGYAHSVEAWQGDRLVGGLYGVSVAGTFAGESMFYEEPSASKLALLHLMDHLKARGLPWIDIQVMTPHMQALGARNLPRREFLDLLKQTQRYKLKPF